MHQQQQEQKDSSSEWHQQTEQTLKHNQLASYEQPTHIVICILVVEFWISGLFVLSVIFTRTQDYDLDNLTLCTFIAYAVCIFLLILLIQIGSFVSGVLSDVYGRRPLFLASSVLLMIAAAITVQYKFWGYVLANLAIGPLNNLTFVFINELFPDKAERYTIFVLIGWAFSQITLGGWFLIWKAVDCKDGGEIWFFWFLLAVSAFYTLCTVLYVKQTGEFLKLKNNKVNLSDICDDQEQKQSYGQVKSQDDCLEQHLQPSVKDSSSSSSVGSKIKLFCQQKIVPKTIIPLVGGSALMFTMQMFYYRTQFTLDTFGVSLQINTIVVGCTQLFANLIFTKILQSVRRRLALRLLIVGLMLLLLGLIFLNMDWMQTVIQGLMRLFDTGIMIVLGVYIPELFPIDQRGRGTNFIMSFGVIGSALNGKVFRHLPFWSLEGFLLFALGMTWLLKETKCKGENKSQVAKF